MTRTWIVYWIAYLIAINIIGFFAMGMDKWKARTNRWRIPEKTLFAISIVGGSIGTLTGMYAFHHKTKHWYFKVGMPLILALQCVGVIAIMYRYM